MNIAVVLGYKLNKDASMDKLLVKRLNLLLKLYHTFLNFHFIFTIIFFIII